MTKKIDCIYRQLLFKQEITKTILKMKKFEYSYFYDYIKRENKPDYSVKNLHSIHFGRLHGYHDDWNLYRILLFEYYLQCYKRFGQKFTRKTSIIKDETRLGKSSIFKYTEEFEIEGYLTVHRHGKAKGKDFLNRYEIHFEGIKSSFDQIYALQELSGDERVAAEQHLHELYDYLKVNFYKSN